MSRTIPAPARGLSAIVAGLIALLLLALAAVTLAPRAEAAFTTGKCAGSDIVGRGASFARDAHNVFINNFSRSTALAPRPSPASPTKRSAAVPDASPSRSAKPAAPASG